MANLKPEDIPQFLRNQTTVIHYSWRLAQKGLAFRSKRSMCVVIARANLPRAATGRPDLSSVRGSSQ
jgi:hypothetical protein